MHISPWFAGRKEKSMKYLNKVVEIILEVLVAGMVLGCCWHGNYKICDYIIQANIQRNY